MAKKFTLDDVISDLTPDDEDLARGARLGYIAKQVDPSRIKLNCDFRQLLGYMLQEKDWMSDDIEKVYIAEDNQVYYLINYEERSGSCSIPKRHSSLIESLPFVKSMMLRLSQRAELSNEDTEFLCGLPGVRDYRKNKEGAE